LNVFITWGVFNAMENILAFYFQYVQDLTPLQSSLRFLPAPAAGAMMNIIMGLTVHRVRADWTVILASVISCGAPLIMAFAKVHSTYWQAAFPAIFLNPIGADTLFTISNLLITSVFPARTQGLAGGVFNTIAQIGKSVGLATSAVIAASVTARAGRAEKQDPAALLEGYHAAWFYGFAMTVLQILFSVWGLRKIGRVGVKQD
jgi:nitrate/nitrite transporter NarK